MKEERSLLNALAERMGSIIERKQVEEALEAANQLLNASNQQLVCVQAQNMQSEFFSHLTLLLPFRTCTPRPMP